MIRHLRSGIPGSAMGCEQHHPNGKRRQGMRTQERVGEWESRRKEKLRRRGRRERWLSSACARLQLNVDFLSSILQLPAGWISANHPAVQLEDLLTPSANSIPWPHQWLVWPIPGGTAWRTKGLVQKTRIHMFLGMSGSGLRGAHGVTWASLVWWEGILPKKESDKLGSRTRNEVKSIYIHFEYNWRYARVICGEIKVASVKRWVTNWEKIFSIDVTNKGQ